MKTAKSLLIICAMVMTTAAVLGFMNYKKVSKQVSLSGMYKNESIQTKNSSSVMGKQGVDNISAKKEILVKDIKTEKQTNVENKEENAEDFTPQYNAKKRGTKGKRISTKSYSRAAIEEKYNGPRSVKVDNE